VTHEVPLVFVEEMFMVKTNAYNILVGRPSKEERTWRGGGIFYLYADLTMLSVAQTI
jgi:hypothetical protein